MVRLKAAKNCYAARSRMAGKVFFCPFLRPWPKCRHSRNRGGEELLLLLLLTAATLTSHANKLVGGLPIDFNAESFAEMATHFDFESSDDKSGEKPASKDSHAPKVRGPG